MQSTFNGEKKKKKGGINVSNWGGVVEQKGGGRRVNLLLDRCNRGRNNAARFTFKEWGGTVVQIKGKGLG